MASKQLAEQKSEKLVDKLDVRLGELKGPWADYCKARKIKPGKGVRLAIERLLEADRKARGGEVSSAVVQRPSAGGQTYRIVPVVESKQRVWVRLTESEHAAAELRARTEGFSSVNVWIAASVRAALTNSPQFGQVEIEALGESNLQLLKIGRNLNQIAKHLNTQRVDLLGYDPQMVERLAEAVRRHVRKVGDALNASIYRWKLTPIKAKQ